ALWNPTWPSSIWRSTRRSAPSPRIPRTPMSRSTSPTRCGGRSSFCSAPRCWRAHPPRRDPGDARGARGGPLGCRLLDPAARGLCGRALGFRDRRLRKGGRRPATRHDHRRAARDHARDREFRRRDYREDLGPGGDQDRRGPFSEGSDLDRENRLRSATQGEIAIEGAQSDSVEASTVNGPVTFEGAISDAGFYRFATHNGCIDVAMPERSNATLSLSTFSGGIDSSFPVTLKKIKSRRFQTTLGSGRAKLELESFQGTIFLRRPNEARSRCTSEDEDKGEEHEKAESDEDDDE